MVTMRDVGKKAGVSQSTVSRVLNNVSTPIQISEEVRNRVLNAARELNYRPNPLARALRGGTSRLIGVIVRDIEDPFYAPFIASLSKEVRNHEFNLLLGHASNSQNEAIKLGDILDTRHCDGLLMLGDLPEDDLVFEQLEGLNVPIISLCRGKSVRGNITINTDNSAGMQMLLSYLVKLGHKRIAFINGAWGKDIEERRESYLRLMQEFGLESYSMIIQADQNGFDGGYNAMQLILSLRHSITAIAAADDAMAIGAMRAASEMNVSIPDELSVVGFDDLLISRYFIPSLTTIRQPVEDIVSYAVSRLVKIIEENESNPASEIIRLPPQLIIRDSCAINRQK